MSHLARPEVQITLPVTLKVEGPADASNPLWLATAIACEPWNKIRPTFNLISEGVPFAHVVWDHATWVDMPTLQNMSAIVHFNRSTSEWYMNYWMPHELGHVINLADHIQLEYFSESYINPITDPNDPYQGVMSYKTHNTKWFGPDDVAMMQEHYPMPLTHRVVVPGV